MTHVVFYKIVSYNLITTQTQTQQKLNIVSINFKFHMLFRFHSISIQFMLFVAIKLSVYGNIDDKTKTIYSE